VINSAMARELGFSRETLGLITSFYIIMSGLPGPIVAMSVNRFGVRRTLLAGSTLNVAGAVFMATVANSGIAAYFGFGLLIGGGVCSGAAIASQTGLSRWFIRRRAMAMSILYSAGAIGGYIATKTHIARCHRRHRQLAQRLVGHRRLVRARGSAGAGVREGKARGHGPHRRR
jgi:MFS family permease